VFIGGSPTFLNRVVEDTTATSYTFAAGQRPPIENGTVYWRVDAIADGERVTGDVWSFDPRPAAPAPTSPEHEATGQTLHVGATWSNAAAAQTYELRIAEGEWLLPIVVTGLTGHTVLNLSDYLVLRHARTYYWRVDSRNSFGVTEGPVFSFTTMPFIRAMPSYELLPQVPPQDPPVDPLGPLDGGVVGVDFRWTGGNNMISVRRLVVAANNKLWYEDV
jgi:hypothetical protein